jgi:purine-binding chemotaxis protein CheW
MNQLQQDYAMDRREDGELEVLSFELQGEVFALEATLVQEILDVLPETAVPGAPPLVGGVINFRGKVIPLADLRVAFGMEASDAGIDSRIVVIEMDIQGERTLIGLRTDRVREVTTLALASSEAPPSVGMRWRPDFIRRLIKRGGEFIVIPDLAAIFSSSGEALAASVASLPHH